MIVFTGEQEDRIRAIIRQERAGPQTVFASQSDDTRAALIRVINDDALRREEFRARRESQ